MRLNLETKEPNISIVMPVFNAMPYLKEAINSILNQTFSSFELICVDNGSEDESVAFLNQVAVEDGRIRLYINEENKGAWYSRNRGLKIAKGKYVIFLDADDFFDEKLLEIMHSTIEKKTADFVVCNYYQIDLDGKIKSEVIYPSWVYRRMSNNVLLDENQNKHFFVSILSNALWVRLYKREWLLKNKIEFEQSYHFDDIYFSFRAILRAKRIAFVDENISPLIFWRRGFQSSQSINITNPKSAYLEICKMNNYIKFGQNDYSKYKSILFSKTVRYMAILLSRLSDLQRRELLSWIRRDGIALLGFNGWGAEDFLCPDDYERFVHIILNTGDDNIITDLIKILFDVPALYDAFKHDLNQYILWGYGLYGRGLYSLCQEKGISIYKVVDMSDKLIGKDIGGHIIESGTSVELSDCDMILTTGYKLQHSIIKELETKGYNNPVVDVMAFCREGASFEDSIQYPKLEGIRL